MRARREHYARHPFIRPEHVRTPGEAVTDFQALADVGIEYFLVTLFDVSDQETLRLLAEQVVPDVTSRSTGPTSTAR